MSESEQQETVEIADRLNARPRKRYAYATPLERLDELRALHTCSSPDLSKASEYVPPRYPRWVTLSSSLPAMR